MKAIRKLERWIGSRLALVLPRTASKAFVSRVFRRDARSIYEAIGPYLTRDRSLGSMPLDLPVHGPLRFEHLAGLFASTLLDHGVISMTVRQAGYIFGLVQHLDAQKVIEIGRYKGGSTFVIAAAMKGRGQFWSVDVGHPRRAFDRELSDVCKRFGLAAELIVGDSRAVEIDSGPVDLVLIDGDHSYAAAKTDFERFGQRVRRGGAVLFDDAFDDGTFDVPASDVGRLVAEIVTGGEFRLVKRVDRLAHLERVTDPRG